MIPIEKNKQYTAQITAMSSDGNGVARIDGYAVFIPHTSVGDTVRFLTLKTKNSYGIGRLTEIISPSPDRRAPECDAFCKCGGCQLMHIAYSAQLKFKQNTVLNNLMRIGGFNNIRIEPIVGADEPIGYRNKMIFSVGYENERVICGFYAPQSHKIISADRCLLGNSNAKKITDAVLEYMMEFKVPAYNDPIHSGCIRHIFIREARNTGEIMAVITANSSHIPHADELVQKIRSASDKVSSIILNINKHKTNLALGEKNITLWGSDTINDTLCGIRYRISPQSFFQINPVQTERLYAKAIEFAALTGKENVMDLYCGIGTISLACARSSKKVIGVEAISQAVSDAKQNALENKINNAVFYAGCAENIVPRLIKKGERPDVVILDPPRKGSDISTLGAIVSANPDKIVYVSCNSATLARDLKYLAENGYTLKTAAPFDMFPQTSHVETVALMTRIQEK